MLPNCWTSATGYPTDLARWLSAGLQAWQRGADLEIALQLDGDTLDFKERDGLIRAAIRLCPGADECDQLSYFIGLVSDRRRHPDSTGETAACSCCARARCYIPTSAKHLTRILAGHRGTECGLCPDRDCRGKIMANSQKEALVDQVRTSTKQNAA